MAPLHLSFVPLLLAAHFAVGELLSRELLFGQPRYAAVKLSPDGLNVGFLAPNEQNVTNVFVQCIECSDATPLTDERATHVVGRWRATLVVQSAAARSPACRLSLDGPRQRPRLRQRS